jgi:hypothetical protein
MANVPHEGAGLPPAVPPGGPVGPPPGLPPWGAPGLIAQTLQDKTNGHTPEDLLNEVNTIDNMFNDPTSDAIALHHRAVLANEPTCFLTIVNSEPPRVRLIHTMGQFQTAFGVRDGLLGKTFAFAGEQEGTQLPAILLEPVVGTGSLFSVFQCIIPTQAQIDAYYVNGVVPALQLLDTVAREPDDSNIAGVCKLGFVPTMWASALMEPQHPFVALQVVNTLVAALPAPMQPGLGYLQRWLRAACTCHGPLQPRRNWSLISTGWMPFIPTRDFTRWAIRHVERIFDTPIIAQNLAPTANNIVQATLEAMKGMRAADRASQVPKFTDLEKRRILSACSLTAADWGNEPPFYSALMTEGRTKLAVQALLQSSLRPDANTDDPVLIYISPELVKDIKDLQFGSSYDIAYRTCHRGLTPFSVPHTSIARQADLRHMAEDMAEATSTTTADVKASRSRPPPCPQTFLELLRMLSAYTKLLSVLCGPDCEHLIQVLAMRQELRMRSDMLGEVTPQNVAHLLWAVFLDSRQFFSHDVWANAPATSNLNVTVTMLRMGHILPIQSCPLGWLLIPEATSVTLDYTAPPAQTPDNIFSSPPNQNGRLNNKVHPRLAGAVRDLKGILPNAQIRNVLDETEPKLLAKDIQISPGGCLDFLVFGQCNYRSCRYKHTGDVDESKIDSVVQKLKPAIDKLTQKKKRKRND